MEPWFFGPEAWFPLARALGAYRRGEEDAVLTIHSDAGGWEAMPVSVFFRGRGELPRLEREALALCRGRILDVGAGPGALSLLLQENGRDVTALEVIPEAVEILRSRGVEKVVEGRLQDLEGSGAFDTLLLLMNGASLAGTLAGFPRLLATCARLLAPGGRLLVDSTDLRARMAGGGGGRGVYELHYQLEFRGERGAPFPQLYLDPDSLLETAAGEGWTGAVVCRGEAGEYLARLSPKPGRP